MEENLHNEGIDISNALEGDSAEVSMQGTAKQTKSRLRRLLMGFMFFFSVILFIPLLVLFFLYVIPGIQEFGKGRNSIEVNDVEFKQQPNYAKQIALLDKELQKVTKKLNAFTPNQPYIVISTTNNRFFLYENKTLVREGFCSSGSYTLLLTEGPKRWIFKTPKGKFRILSKMIDPVWKKPDWAFVEEGLPIPSADHDSRFEYGVLGDYALEIGDGYLIHGTIYKRFLGMPVTHGCIRLNDDDLKVIYKTLDFGSKVYIY
ncbi:MAG: L,D-transpeptidase [Bacteroidales bacterium]|nr:MAG: L,D-transpeptidase [Bacteroidales bacterium]